MADTQDEAASRRQWAEWASAESRAAVQRGLDDGRLVRIGDDVVVPAEFKAESMGFVGKPILPGPATPSFRMSEGAPSGVDVAMQLRIIDGTPHCTYLVLASSEPGKGIPPKAVREFRLEDWIEKTYVNHALHYDRATGQWDRDYSGRTVLPSIRKARARARGGYTDDLLQDVATIYEAHADRYPTKAVREHYGFAQSTAQLYVKKAREKGYITSPAPKGGRS